MRVAHLSRVRGSADGGISPIVEQLSAAQASVAHHAEDCLAWFTPPDNLRASLHLFCPDLLHVHGLWSTPNRFVALRRHLPTVFAPQGMLDPWAMQQKRWRKRIAWTFFEQANLQKSGAVQALSISELQAVRELGISAPIAILPNAVELPNPPLHSAGVPAWQEFLPRKRYLLFLSRFHKKKGIDVLLRAWQELDNTSERADWHLLLAGYGDNGELARRVAQAHRCGELQDVTVIGPVFGAEKTATLFAASAFVLPSYSEGLPMAALEAMAHRLPCLFSAACNIPEAFSSGAALCADPDISSLVSALRQLFSLSSADLGLMGRRGHDLVASRFSWSHVAKQTWELYRWILGGGDRPSFVEFG